MADEPRSRSAAEREAARQARAARRSGAAPEPVAGAAPEPPGDPELGDEPDLPPVAPPRRARERPPRAELTRTRAASARPRRPGGPRKVIARLFALVSLVLVAAVIWFLIELFQPFTGSGHGRIVVTIPPDSGAHQIGDLLAHDGVVASGFFFNLRATIDGDRGKLLAGRHVMRYGMSYSAALGVLMTPPPAARTTDVTIIPGHSRQQITAILRGQHVRGDYAAATIRSRLLNPIAYGAPRTTPSLEGFL
jgi:hypothetical protein